MYVYMTFVRIKNNFIHIGLREFCICALLTLFFFKAQVQTKLYLKNLHTYMQTQKSFGLHKCIATGFSEILLCRLCRVEYVRPAKQCFGITYICILTSDPMGAWKLPALLGSYDRQTNRQTDRRAHRKVSLPIIY